MFQNYRDGVEQKITSIVDARMEDYRKTVKATIETMVQAHVEEIKRIYTPPSSGPLPIPTSPVTPAVPSASATLLGKVRNSQSPSPSPHHVTTSSPSRDIQSAESSPKPSKSIHTRKHFSPFGPLSRQSNTTHHSEPSMSALRASTSSSPVPLEPRIASPSVSPPGKE